MAGLPPLTFGGATNVPRDLSTVTPPSDLVASLAGMAPLIGQAPKARRGNVGFKAPKPCHMMVMGDWGKGKTFIIVSLLKAGYKVFGIMVDFGKTGFNTVYNHFAVNPKDRTLPDGTDCLANFYEIELKYATFVNFRRDPVSMVPDFWEFDPDFLFVDGMSAYQLAELENTISGGDPLRENMDWSGYRKSMNGAIFPMIDLLAIQKPDGRPLHKIVTYLEEKKSEWEKTGNMDPKTHMEKREVVSGSTKYGPLLHTGARKLSGAGFDIIFRCSVEGIKEDKYVFEFHNTEALLKKRGYALPDKAPADFAKVWREYIEPLHDSSRS